MNKINELNLDNIVHTPKILIIGGRACGKSVLCQSLINHFNNSDKKIVVCDTEYFDIGTYVGMGCQIMKLGNNTFEEILSEHVMRRRESPTYSTILCLDICTYDREIFNNRALLGILYDGRNLGITIIMTIRSAAVLSSRFVDIFDYIFAFYSDNTCEREKLYLRYFNELKPYAFFSSVFDDATENAYTALVINKRVVSSKIEDIIFHFKAKE